MKEYFERYFCKCGEEIAWDEDICPTCEGKEKAERIFKNLEKLQENTDEL